MTQTLQPRQGLSAPIVTSIPEKWDREWMRTFITYFLQLGKIIQNGIVNGLGISISTSPTGQQQISLASQPGTSVLGVAGGAAAGPAAIIATADGQVLQRSGGALVFAPVGGSSASASVAGPPGADGDPGDDGSNYQIPPPPSTQPIVLAGPYTVATLPAASALYQGAMAYVTDATAPTYNAALVGGGAVIVPVFCNGTAWTSH